MIWGESRIPYDKYGIFEKTFGSSNWQDQLNGADFMAIAWSMECGLELPARLDSPPVRNPKLPFDIVHSNHPLPKNRHQGKMTFAAFDFKIQSFPAGNNDFTLFFSLTTASKMNLARSEVFSPKNPTPHGRWLSLTTMKGEQPWKEEGNF
jgi:hypothetical protein